MSSIRLENVTKSFGGGPPAVQDINLEVDNGEFVILVGPSGCGKSTILRMIVGLEDITSGDVYIGDQRVNEKAPRDRNLAMVFQNYALYPHLTVFENIAFPLRLHKLSDDEVRERVERAANMLELGELLERKPSQLSGGQRQRVAMGRAIVRNADAFLFDEPLSNLDAKLRGQMRTEISRLQNQLAITTVYVTHDQIEAMTLGDRVAVLRKGALQQVDAPRELYEQPVNLFVAGFIGSPPMNFLPAGVEDSTLHLPIGDIELTRELAEDVKGRDILIAGVRPEHFEDAAMLDGRPQGGGVDLQGPRRRDRVAGERAVRLHPVRGTRGGAATARRARHRAGQRADPHAAGGHARRREPGERGRGRQPVARPQPHAPVRPRLGREPHPRPRHRDPHAGDGVGPARRAAALGPARPPPGRLRVSRR